MSTHRRRPQQPKAARRGWKPLWDDSDYFATASERVRHVPDDWRGTWAPETMRICGVVWNQWAFRLYPIDTLAREDFADWLWLQAVEYAAGYEPRDEPDAFDSWGAHLHAALSIRAKWHWAEFHGKTAYEDEGGRHVAQVGSIDALLDREGTSTMHVAQRVDASGLWSWQPLVPEQYVRILELDAGVDDDVAHAPAKDPSLCATFGCQQPARANGLCTGHTSTHWRQWEAGTCAVEGCTALAVVKGACSTHYRQARQTDASVPRCIEPGCDSAVRSRRLCDKHLHEYRRDGRELPPGREPKAPAPCSLDGCDQPVLAKGLCRSHYRAERRAQGLSQ